MDKLTLVPVLMYLVRNTLTFSDSIFEIVFEGNGLQLV